MTPERPSPEEQRAALTGAEAIHWLQAELQAERAHSARLGQQLEQLQAMALDLAEQVRALDAGQRNLGASAAAVSAAHDALLAMQDLINKLQEGQMAVNARIDRLERERRAEGERERTYVNELSHRLQSLERDVQTWADRQNSVEDFSRRFQESLSRLDIAVRDMAARTDSAETKAARAVDSVNRAELTLADAERLLTELKREDEVLNERLRLAQEVVHRIEGQLQTYRDEYKDLPLLRERLDLLRAERQRVEDRATRLESAVFELETWRQKQEHLSTTLDAKYMAQEARLEQMVEKLDEYKSLLIGQLLKLHQSQERLKRRQIEDLEREIKELRKHAASLNDE